MNDCTCEAITHEDMPDHPVVSLCPLHAAAPRLLAALQALADAAETALDRDTGADRMKLRAEMKAARAAIAEAQR